MNSASLPIAPTPLTAPSALTAHYRATLALVQEKSMDMNIPFQQKSLLLTILGDLYQKVRDEPLCGMYFDILSELQTILRSPLSIRHPLSRLTHIHLVLTQPGYNYYDLWEADQLPTYVPTLVRSDRPSPTNPLLCLPNLS